VDEPCDTYREAESVRDYREEVDEHGGYIVVEWEGKFYVVYDETYGGGFADYDRGCYEDGCRNLTTVE
jgi:hypothetical protein